MIVKAKEMNAITKKYSRRGWLKKDREINGLLIEKKSFTDRPLFVMLLSFFVPLLVMWLIYIAMEVYPFGKNSVLVLDLNGQYVYFFEELRNKLVNGGSLLYSWGRSMGGEFMGIFAYYLASPFSFLVALFPKENITEALLTIILLKTGCCGLTMSIYLSKTAPTNRLNTVIFSTMYAVCSYAVVQAHNTMWIDELIFLPLLVLGIERLISKRQYLLYTVSLAFCAMTSFYIGYMMCIFTFLYFFYRYAVYGSKAENNFYGERYHFIKSLLRIALFSAIGLAIACVVLLPAYYSLTFGKTEFSTGLFDFSENGFGIIEVIRQMIEYGFAQKFDFLDMLAKLYPASYDTVRPEGLPFLYCGTLTLILLPIYFISKGVSAREKALTGALMAVIVFSFNSTLLDIIWHGFQKPNWLNYRYSFMLCFLMVVCAYKAFNSIESLQFNYILGVCGILGLLIIIIQKQDYEWVKDISCVWFSVVCLAVYAVVLRPISRGQLKKAGRVVLLITVCVELFISGLLNNIAFDDDVVYSSRTSYRSYMDRLQPVVDFIKNYDAENFGSEFYRMEKNTHRKTNDAMALGFYGLSNSTSTLNASVIAFLNKFGYTSRSHLSRYLGGTPVSDSLLGLKYLIFQEEYTELLYDRIYADDLNELYGFYNPYALSLLYGVDSALYDLDLTEYDTPFEVMNATVSRMLYEDDIQLFKKIKISDLTYENSEISFTTGHKKYYPESGAKQARLIFKLNAVGDNEVFCFFPSDYKREAQLKLNGQDLCTYFTGDNYHIVSLGQYGNGDEIIVTLTLKDDELYIKSGVDYFYYLDYNLFREIMPRLARYNANITHFEDTKITAEMTAPEGGITVFTSIPYDEGWHISVDGEEITFNRMLDALIAFDIDGGSHEITMTYMPSAFVKGAIISGCGLAAFAAAAVIEHLLNKKRRLDFVSESYPEAGI